MGLHINSDELKNAILNSNKVKKIRLLAKNFIEVGFFDDVIHPVNESTKEFGKHFGLGESDPISVAELANYLDKGFFNRATGTYVHPRPFFSNSVNITQDKIKSIIIESLDQDDPISYVSTTIENIIKDQMESGNYDENKALTVQFKNSDTPLKDTGFLYNSVESRTEGK